MLRLFRAKARYGEAPAVFLVATDARLARELARKVFQSPYVFVHVVVHHRREALEHSADFTPTEFQRARTHQKQQALVARLGAYLDDKKANAVALLKAGATVDEVVKQTRYSRSHVLRIKSEVTRVAPDPAKWCAWCGRPGFDFCGSRCLRLYDKDRGISHP